MKLKFPDELRDIEEKVNLGQRLSAEDGTRLYETPDLNAVGYLANIVRERACGNAAWYVRNQHINYTNVCNKLCRFCSFYVKPKDARGYVLSPEDIQKRVLQYIHLPISEIHMVAGVNPKLPYSYYLDIVRAVKDARPDVAVKAFTAIEWVQIARIAKKPLKEVMVELKAAGVSSIPGGGAEVFSDRVQEDLFWTKADSEQWLSVARTAHEVGLHTNATMLYGHIENPQERIHHLVRLRELQDETGGFLTYIPPFLSPRAHGVDAFARPHGHCGFARDRSRALDAGQFPAHQNLLDYEYHRDFTDGVVVWRGRYRRHHPRIRNYAPFLQRDAASAHAQATRRAHCRSRARPGRARQSLPSVIHRPRDRRGNAHWNRR